MNRWSVYEYMKFRYMQTGLIPRLSEVVARYPGISLEELREGMIEFYILVFREPPEWLKSEAEEKYEYNAVGYMKYNPSFHPNHRKPFTDEELEYLCKFAERDTIKQIAFALGKTEATIAAKLATLRQNGLYEYYRKRRKYYPW